MSDRRSQPSNHVLLIASTTVLVLTFENFLANRLSRPQPEEASPDSFAPELAQKGRGRHSSSPFQIPWAGWKDILWRPYQRTGEDRLLATAAGVVFYGLLAVFPAITALVSSYGLFADPSTVAGNLQSRAVLLPEGSFSIVQDQIGRVLAKENTTLGLTFIFGLLFAIWSANAGMKAVL